MCLGPWAAEQTHAHPTRPRGGFSAQGRKDPGSTRTGDRGLRGHFRARAERWRRAMRTSRRTPSRPFRQRGAPPLIGRAGAAPPTRRRCAGRTPVRRAPDPNPGEARASRTPRCRRPRRRRCVAQAAFRNEPCVVSEGRPNYVAEIGPVPVELAGVTTPAVHRRPPQMLMLSHWGARRPVRHSPLAPRGAASFTGGQDGRQAPGNARTDLGQFLPTSPSSCVGALRLTWSPWPSCSMGVNASGPDRRATVHG